VEQVAAAAMKLGGAGQSWISHFVIAPPLVISAGEIDEGVAALDECLQIADAMAA